MGQFTKRIFSLLILASEAADSAPLHAAIGVPDVVAGGCAPSGTARDGAAGCLSIERSKPQAVDGALEIEAIPDGDGGDDQVKMQRYICFSNERSHNSPRR